MKSFRAFTLPLCAQWLATMYPGTAFAADTPPPLEIKTHQLPNGLKVVLAEDRSRPVVNLQVWYHVGSKDEKAGRTGFAHLFEHLMFRGSKNVGPEEHMRLVREAGGQVNAGTSFDTTVYWETVPSNFLERMIWLEADRMASLDVSEENFKKEREVVKEERRLRFENPPYGLIMEDVLKNSYQRYPYKHPPIGSMEDLNKATIADVREFHSTYYTPNNATVVLVGDFAAADALKLIEKHLGKVPRGKQTPRVSATEPEPTGARESTVRYKNIPLDAVVTAYPLPPMGHPDSYALEIASSILSSGQSSRLYKRLVYDEQAAAAAAGEGLFLEGPSLFFGYAIANQGKNIKELAVSLEYTFAELSEKPVSDEELAKAKNQTIAGFILGREGVQAKADYLGRCAVLLGDPNRYNSELESYRRVTAADVQRVVKKYLAKDRQVKLWIHPEAGESKGESKSGEASESPGTEAKTATSRAAAKQKAAAPAAGAPRSFEFPKPVSRTLANGLKVYVVQDHRLPVVSLALQILAGGAYAPREKAGLATMTAGLLREGTKTRSSQELARLVDGSGGSLGASATDDTTAVNGSFMKSYAGLGMELLADIVRNPAFAQEEIDRQMTQAQSGLAVQYNSAEYLAPLAAARAMLGTHPYAWPGDGTPETLKNIRREDIVGFYEANYAPGRAWLAIAGDLTPDEGFALAEKHLGPWKAAAAPDGKLPAPPARKAQVLVVDMPDAVQSQIVVGHLGVQRNHPDFVALNLANQVFGGSFNSRLNAKLRASEGLTYDASSGLQPNRQAGLFTASTFTRTEKTADAIRMLVELLKEFKASPATEAEFNEAKAFVLGSFGLSTETSAAVAGRVLASAVFGLGDDYWPNYRALIEKTTRDQVIAAVGRLLEPDKLTIAAVGNAKVFTKQLEAFGPVRVIAQADFDPVAPDMARKREASTPEKQAEAKSLLAAVAEAMGGREKLASVKDSASKGKLKLTLPQGAMEGETSEEVLYPDRYKAVMSLPMGQITEAVDAEKGWMAQGAAAEELPAEMTAELKKNIAAAAGGLGVVLMALDGRAEVFTGGEAAVDGARARVIFWKAGAFEAALAVDPAAKRLIRMTYKTLGMNGPVETESIFKDFRAVDGLSLPFTEIIFQNGRKIGERAITERKLNTGLSPERFGKK